MKYYNQEGKAVSLYTLVKSEPGWAANRIAGDREEIETLRAENERLRADRYELIAATHTGMKISATGILGRISEGRYYKGLNHGCGVMLDHLKQMADRFYAGDVKAVDEFLQLYCLDDKRPALLAALRGEEKK